MEIFIQRSSLLNTINGVGSVFRAVGLDPFKLNAQKIINKAIKKADYKEEIPDNIITCLLYTSPSPRDRG